MNESKKNLVANTFFLYCLTFINQLLNIVTIPYQTRVFGPELYGSIGMVLALMTYVQLILDFGFILSATEEVAKLNKDYIKISRVYTSVYVVKLVLSGFTLLFLLIFLKSFSDYSYDIIKLYVYYFIAYMINSLLPDFVFRGLEDMRVITVRTVIVKCIFTCFMFIFVKQPKDVLVMPIIQIVANTVALLTSLSYMKKKYKIHFVRVKRQYLINLVKKTIPFFCSRISSTFYQALSMVIVGNKYMGKAEAGFYSSADKIISLSKSVSSPIADSIYPYMIKNKDYSLIKKLLKIIVPIILLCASVAYVFADKIVVLLFGIEYQASSIVLRIMIPTAVVILPTYLLAFPVMVPMGLEKYANLSNVFGAFIQLLGLAVLALSNHINIYSIAALSTCTEISVFLFRVYFILKKKYMRN